MSKKIHSEEVLKALDNSIKLNPDEDFVLRMEEMALAYTNKVKQFNSPTILMMAASFALLIIANMIILRSSFNDTTTQLQSDYILIPAESVYNE